MISYIDIYVCAQEVSKNCNLNLNNSTQPFLPALPPLVLYLVTYGAMRAIRFPLSLFITSFKPVMFLHQKIIVILQTLKALADDQRTHLLLFSAI